MFCGENDGRNDDASNGESRAASRPLIGSGGPISVTASGRAASSVANVRDNCSSRDLRGSTFVGERQVSSDDFGSVEKLSDCFFLLLLDMLLLGVRNRRLRRSFSDSFSLGGLPVFWGSEFGASGSVFPAPPSFPLLSFRQSLPFSIYKRNGTNK